LPKFASHFGSLLTMTAAAARKKRTPELQDDVVEAGAQGLWIDVAHLPTTLAQHGKKKELAPMERWSGVRKDRQPNRLLDHADLALGTKGRRRAVDKEK
jgi:hypothetical protein